MNYKLCAFRLRNLWLCTLRCSLVNAYKVLENSRKKNGGQSLGNLAYSYFFKIWTCQSKSEFHLNLTFEYCANMYVNMISRYSLKFLITVCEQKVFGARIKFWSSRGLVKLIENLLWEQITLELCQLFTNHWFINL